MAEKTITVLFQCPGCWSTGRGPVGADWECDCGEKMTCVDLRAALDHPAQPAEPDPVECDECGLHAAGVLNAEEVEADADDLVRAIKEVASAQPVELDGLKGDVGIRVCELLERAGLESAPEPLWRKPPEEDAWLKGRDDTLAMVREEVEGYIAKAFEEFDPESAQPVERGELVEVVVEFLDSWRFCPVSEATAASRSCLEDAAKQLVAALPASTQPLPDLDAFRKKVLERFHYLGVLSHVPNVWESAAKEFEKALDDAGLSAPALEAVVDHALAAIKRLWEAATYEFADFDLDGNSLPLRADDLFDSSTAYPGEPIKGKELYRIGLALGLLPDTEGEPNA